MGCTALENKTPKCGVRIEELLRPWSTYFCLAKSVFRSLDLYIAEYVERNKGVEIQGSGCTCSKMEGLKVTL